MEQFYSSSANETMEFAENFAKTLKKGSVIAFFGGLGMGKTCFVSGLVKGLGIKCDVSSPTFAIVNEYRGDNNSLFHFDMYRIESWDDLYTTGFFEYIDENEFIAIEWSENIENALPDDTIKIYFEKTDSGRIITIEQGN